MQGVKSFETWDETYVNNQLAEDIRVLMAREERGGYEPYTWVRRQGKGRVFYTAFGHDERAWKNKGFQRLLEQGIRWAAGTAKAAQVKPLWPAPIMITSRSDMASRLTGIVVWRVWVLAATVPLGDS